MDIRVANALFDDGTFTALYKAGFINEKVFIYREIYLWIDAQVKVRGISKRKAVLEAEIRFKRDERTIWKAVKAFS